MIIDEKLLDQVTAEAQASPRLRMNYNFHETLDAPAQRLLNALEPGTVLPIHRHMHTAETYVVLRGRLNVDFYNEDRQVTAHYELDPTKGAYGVNIQRYRHLRGERRSLHASGSGRHTGVGTWLPIPFSPRATRRSIWPTGCPRCVQGWR